MAHLLRLEAALSKALLPCAKATEQAGGSPLAAAMHYSVFPAGARLRPLLALLVAEVGNASEQVLPAATAIELVHSASLVHDDLPSFDDAAIRRGKPSTHRAFGLPIALLTGDALLALSFRVLAPVTCGATREAIAAATCALIEGQALELTATASLLRYHAQKTAGLFAVAAQVGALAAKLPVAPYVALGHAIGQAYQLADDLYDIGPKAANDSKERGSDLRRGQPNAALASGEPVARGRLQSAVKDLNQMAQSLPCPDNNLTAFVSQLGIKFAALADLPCEVVSTDRIRNVS